MSIKYNDTDWLSREVATPLENLAVFFDSRVEKYEAQMERWTPYYEWIAELVPPTTEKLLDLGCGTGLTIDEILEKHPHIAVTGIDLSSGMLERLKQKHLGKKVRLICADYFEFPFGEDEFDVVVSFEALHYFYPEKKLELFKKIQRCLKPGGSFFEGDFMAESVETEERFREAFEKKRTAEKIPYDTYVNFDMPLTLAHELELLEKAGFSEVISLGHKGTDYNTQMIQAIK